MSLCHLKKSLFSCGFRQTVDTKTMTKMIQSEGNTHERNYLGPIWEQKYCYYPTVDGQPNGKTTPSLGYSMIEIKI